MDVRSAAAEAGVTRLRPVLLTASTTVIGLIPTAIGVSYNFQTWAWTTRSESSQMWSNIAIVVIFGLTFATILTLVVVPSLYVMLYRFTVRLGFPALPPSWNPRRPSPARPSRIDRPNGAHNPPE